jgi:hypothetical protein
MKKTGALCAVLLGLALMVFGGCSTYPRSGMSAVTGRWTNALATVWTLKSDGTFEVDLNHDGKHEAWGNYTIEGDTITIRGTGGNTPHDCKGDGVYRFTRGRDTLRFSRVRDKCQLRVRNVMLLWHRQ